MAMTRVGRDEIFLTYAGVECARSLRALDRVKELLAVRRTDAGHVVLEEQSVWDALRMALHFAANVSRVFWPPKSASSTAKKRAEHLRDLAELSETHPLGRRDLRNHVEHFDERLDDWTDNSPRPFLHYEMIRRPEHSRVDPETWEGVCIVFDSGKNELTILGEAFSLTDLRAQLEEVMAGQGKAYDKKIASWGKP